MKRLIYYAILLISILVVSSCNKIKGSDLKQSSTMDIMNAKAYDNSDADYIEDSFDIDIGDNIHYFTVVMRAKPFEEEIKDEIKLFFDSRLEILIYDKDDLSTPVQIFNEYAWGSLFKDNEVLDANFDGYSDFSYVYSRGNCNYNSLFWLWDEEMKCFKFSEDLSNLSIPQFDYETKVVQSFSRGSAASNETRYYRYFDNTLTCIRVLEMGYPNQDDIQLLRVEDYKNGKLVEVFAKEAKIDKENGGFYGVIYDEFFKWQDINFCEE